MRAPAVSGRFYPGERSELERVVRALLADVPPGGTTVARAAVAPHAGYAYSGATAAHVFARIEVPRVVVIVAPNHTGEGHAASRVSLWEAGAFRTPLGDVPLEAALASALLAADPIVAVDYTAHRAEHAIEVLLPFLQVRRADVAVVPLVLAGDAWPHACSLAEALVSVIREFPEPVLLLASSDLTHYETATVAERKDRLALTAVADLDGAELLARCRRERISMCGRGPTAVVVSAARALGARHGEVVDYRHSGWVTGDERAVVGYGGVVIS